MDQLVQVRLCILVHFLARVPSRLDFLNKFCQRIFCFLCCTNLSLILSSPNPGRSAGASPLLSSSVENRVQTSLSWFLCLRGARLQPLLCCHMIPIVLLIVLTFGRYFSLTFARCFLAAFRNCKSACDSASARLTGTALGCSFHSVAFSCCHCVLGDLRHSSCWFVRPVRDLSNLALPLRAR